MATEKEQERTPKIKTITYTNLTNFINLYRLETSDNPGTVLVTELLTIENYATWSQSMLRALRAKNKLGFINGTLSKPNDVDDPLFDFWARCNDMIISWIQNSISNQLCSSVVFVDNAKEIWDELKECFTQQNGPRIYELKKALSNLLQKADSVSVYYGKLKTL